MVSRAWICAGDMIRIGIIAALPGELKPLVKGWKRDGEGTVPRWSQRVGEVDCVATCAGMGADAATRAFAAAEKDGRLDVVVSVGWAGGLDDVQRAGAASSVAEVIDVRTAERFLTASGDGVRLVTTATVADSKEKRRLANEYGAALVDMEAATVGRLARAREVSFYCFKAVTDEAGDTLPDMNPFIDARGQMRTGAFALHSAVRPWQWTSLVRLGRNSSVAAEALKLRVLEFLNGQR
jgi:adenosylhomocysteine nucleosidase